MLPVDSVCIPNSRGSYIKFLLKISLAHEFLWIKSMHLNTKAF